MAKINQVREHMEIIGADGIHIGTVDKVQGDRIKMTKADSGSHQGHHHFIPGGLIATIEGNQVRLSANADNAILFEEEEGGEPLGEQSIFNWKTVGIGVAAVAGVAAMAGAYAMQGRRAENGSRSNGSGKTSSTRKTGGARTTKSKARQD